MPNLCPGCGWGGRVCADPSVVLLCRFHPLRWTPPAESRPCSSRLCPWCAPVVPLMCPCCAPVVPLVCPWCSFSAREAREGAVSNTQLCCEYSCPSQAGIHGIHSIHGTHGIHGIHVIHKIHWLQEIHGIHGIHKIHWLQGIHGGGVGVKTMQVSLLCVCPCQSCRLM